MRAAAPRRLDIPVPVQRPLVRRFGKHRCEVRCLRPDDADRLLAFFHTHTPETIHDRYGFCKAGMSHERAVRLVSVDQSHDLALGVFEPDFDRRLIAVGRYCLHADGRSAELAFVVREDRRRLGIATALLRTLVATARARRLECLTAQVLRDNEAMLAVFRNAGAACVLDAAAGITEITLELRRGDPSAAAIRLAPVEGSRVASERAPR